MILSSSHFFCDTNSYLALLEVNCISSFRDLVLFLSTAALTCSKLLCVPLQLLLWLGSLSCLGSSEYFINVDLLKEIGYYVMKLPLFLLP